MTYSARRRGCPLCDRDVADTGDLRIHMMTHHRKSELTDELLALHDGDADDVDRESERGVEPAVL